MNYSVMAVGSYVGTCLCWMAPHPHLLVEFM